MPRDDDYGQVDGEQPFATSMHAQPWIQQSGLTPWHLWGNTQRIVTTVSLGGSPGVLDFSGVSQTLVRIAYGRPDTWHWVLSSRLIRGPDSTPGEGLSVLVFFDAIIGIGRSVIRMIANPNIGTNGFDNHTFVVAAPATAFPVDANIWSTQSLGVRIFSTAGLAATEFNTFRVDQIAAQDITLLGRVVAFCGPGNVAALGQPVELEVAAQFSPKTHVRPDWYQLDVPTQAQFPGEELRGR